MKSNQVKRFRVKIRSKNHTLNPLRGNIYLPFRSVVRMGSTTSTKEIWPKSYELGRTIVELNTVEAIENSRSKLLMKACFAKAETPQADWWSIINADGWSAYPKAGSTNFQELNSLPYPILAKRVFGFKGHGMVMLENKEDLEDWLKKNSTKGYYFEQFKNFAREYRLHCTEEDCFYAVRKMLKSDTDDDSKWYRNDSNCIWATEFTIKKNEAGNVIGYDETQNNEMFDRPVNWEKIKADCIKALKSTGLKIGAFDVKVQSARNKRNELRDNPEYIIIEVNSAPSFGELTLQKYREKIPEVLKSEYNKLVV